MSLRIRLLLLLGGVWILLGGMMTLWMFERATTKVDDALDARLASSASMVARLISQIPVGAGAPFGMPEGPLDVLARDGVACEVSQWRGEVLSRTIARVDGGPALRDASAGFGSLIQHGVAWRTYVMEEGDLRVATADRMDMRTALRTEIALTALVPLAAGLLAGLLLLWLGIGRGLAPMERLRRSLAQGKPLAELQLRYRRIPKELRPFAQTITQLLRSMEQALERERRFSDNAAHEMRTPVTAVKTHLQVLARLPAPTESALWRQSLDHALLGTARLERLLEQLLLLARVENSTEQVFGDGLHCDAVVVLKPLIKALPTARITLASPSESIHVALSDTLLVSAVRNLLDNALAYSPADQTIDVTLTPSASSLEISVRDRGPGLSADQCERAVEPFWRGVRHTSGSGLGLSIVAAIAKQHGGLLQLLPAPDGGLACRLTLPLAAAGSS
ncbi:two-component sensor histidine kinase [Achromobacter sp. MYb9]|uniref:sensor histidine kinase n=1 Tax=Achromobacter sp. MYb9 TaxID=1827284 RepID=UPI000CFC81F2|nr:ATP-binding protein [Achromobacter sp. MYb9]PQZ67664.1 two-component sensor histidine kinase [Achromobacter sp. MYb9]